MMARRLSLALLLAFGGLAGLAWAPGCGGDGSGFGDTNDPDGSVPDGSCPGCGFEDSGFGDDDGGITGVLKIEPLAPTVEVTINDGVLSANTVPFKAKIQGADVAASWSLDRGELGTFAPNGTFTASGNLSGVATVTARYQRYVETTKVTIKLRVNQNGAPPGTVPGGVGGAPLGGKVGQPVIDRLKGTPTALADGNLLYPYNNTVWPRGLLAPLLQWKPLPSGRPVTAVRVTITHNGLQYDGYFGGANLPNQPIEAGAWKKATYGNAGDDLKVEIRLDDGQKTYGPLKRTWKVAPGVLKGTVYYNSYDTKLAVPAGSETTSAGVLAIKPGQVAPVLAIPENKNKCFVCHTVSDDGSTLFAQQGNYKDGVSYDLRTVKKIKDYTGNAPDGTSNDRKFLWSGVYKDGTFALQSSNQTGNWTQEGYKGGPSRIFRRDNGNTVPASGFDGVIKEAVTPAFSGDGKKVAFSYWTAEPGAPVPAGAGHSLAVMDFACGAGGGGGGPSCGSFGFSGLRVLYTNANREHGFVGWPAWVPDGKGIVFHNQIKRPETENDSPIATWYKAQAELWYVNTIGAARAVAMKNLNGPAGEGAHAADPVMNYEPTVNPIASGGYFWVVFTSRRQYGNVAAGDPYEKGDGTHPIPKKLWVAAINMNATPGADPSFPAFYLPGQELNAGNLRGFWTVDPCRANGTTCETGDECCNGFCRQGTSGGPLVCSDKPQGCAQEFEHCNVDADCCNNAANYKCVNNRCARPIIN